MAITDPRDISGLVAWYSAQSITGLADNATMTAWNDISGNANHATVTVGAPKYRTTLGPGSGPCVHIDSGTFALPTGIMSGTGEILASFWSPGTIVGGLIDMGTSTDNNHFPYGGDLYDDFGSTVRKSQGGPIAASTWYRYAAMSKAGGWSSWLNGTAKYTTATNTTGWRSPLQIGSSGSSYSGRTTFVVLYNRELTSGERADLDAWAVANPNGGTATAGPTTINGALSTETDTAQAGAVISGAVSVGAQATETDIAQAGTTTTGAVVTGTLATESDEARAGSLVTGTVIAGTTSTETDEAMTGTVATGALVVGSQSVEVDEAMTAIVGPTTITGATAQEIDEAFAGIVVGLLIQGNMAQEGDFAGWGAVRVMPPVTPSPVVGAQAVVVGRAFGAVTMQGSQAVYAVASAYTPKARQRIVVDGVDVTYFRGAITPDVTYTLLEPLLYGPATLDVPQVSACFETLGVGDLSWLRPGAEVTVQRVLDDVVVGTDWKGVVVAFDTNGRHLSVELGGEVSGRAALRDRQPVIFPRINDLGRQWADGVKDLGVSFYPPLGPVTGIEVMTTGGTGHHEWFNERVAIASTRSGRQWTVMPDETTGAYEGHRKDDETIHATAFIDDAKTVANLRRDISEEPNRIFVTGVTPQGQRIRFGVYPGLIQGPTPDFPGHMELGSTGDGVRLLIGKLHAMGYLKLVDAAGGYDSDVVDAVTALQIDAGLFDDGFIGTAVPGEVNAVTWAALYDLGITENSLEWAHIEPAAQRRKVRQWNRSGTGGIMGVNPDYDPNHLVRDRTIDMGVGFTRSQLREFARTVLHDSDAPNWVGDITFHTGALIRGDGFEGMAVDAGDVMDARELRPGMNIDLPQFDGGTLVHVAAIQVDDSGTVTATVDTRFRDAMEVWETITRNKESRNDPSRRRQQKHRSSTIRKDSIGEWDEIGGLLPQDFDLVEGWNTFEVVGAMEGTISRIRIVLDEPAEFACAVFGRTITADRLNNLIPNPLTNFGGRAWETKADELEERMFLAAFGTKDEPCGYSPGRKNVRVFDEGTDEETTVTINDPTGKFVDDGGFRYASANRTELTIAVFVTAANMIPLQRILRPQLEAAV